MKIKKLTYNLLILCCTLFLSISISYAQDYQSSSKPLTFGVRAGFSQSVLTIDNQPSSYYRISPIVGGFVQYRVLPWVAASVELLYTQYGGNGISPLLIYTPDSPVLNNLGKTDLFIHSIDLPVSAKFSLPDFSGSIKPFVSAGAIFTYNTQANAINYFVENNGSSFPYIYSANDIVTSRVKSNNFSFITGVGAEFIGNKFNFSFELYYRIGLTDLNQIARTYAPNYRANAFGVKIGIGL